jgi:hypothetical protein
MCNLNLKLALAAGLLASTVGAQAAAYLKFDGVDGGTRFAGTLSDFRWSQALAGPDFDPYQPAHAGGVNVAVGDVTGDGRLDSFVLRASDDGGSVFFEYRLQDVLVTSYQTTASGDHKDWILIESMSGPMMRWSPLLATGGRGAWIEGRWDDDSGRFVGDPAVLGAFDELGAVRWADGSLAITAAVPEPGSWALMLLGVAALSRLKPRAQTARA